MSGAFLQPSTRADADWGVLFVEVSGCLPMCGHGTIGVATVLVEMRHGGGARARDRDPARHAGWARRGDRDRVRRARGAGHGFATCPRSWPSSMPRRGRLARERSDTTWRSAATSMRSIPAAAVGLEPVAGKRAGADRSRARDHGCDQRVRVAGAPGRRRIRGCKHVVFHAPGTDGSDARNATAIHPGWLDRSPCGTGTSARMAALHARGELALGQEFVNESIIGSRFTGRLVEEVDARRRAGGCARGQRPCLDHGHGPVPARSDRPVPGGLRAVDCRQATGGWRQGNAGDGDRRRRRRPVRRGGAGESWRRGERVRARSMRGGRVGGKRRLDHAVAGDPGPRPRGDRRVAAMAGRSVRAAVDPPDAVAGDARLGRAVRRRLHASGDTSAGSRAAGRGRARRRGVRPARRARRRVRTARSRAAAVSGVRPRRARALARASRRRCTTVGSTGSSSSGSRPANCSSSSRRSSGASSGGVLAAASVWCGRSCCARAFIGRWSRGASRCSRALTGYGAAPRTASVDRRGRVGEPARSMWSCSRAACACTRLLARLGVRLPIAAAKGYSRTLSGRSERAAHGRCTSRDAEGRNQRVRRGGARIGHARARCARPVAVATGGWRRSRPPRSGRCRGWRDAGPAARLGRDALAVARRPPVHRAVARARTASTSRRAHATLGITLAPLTGELLARAAARGQPASADGRVRSRPRDRRRRPGARPRRGCRAATHTQRQEDCMKGVYAAIVTHFDAELGSITTPSPPRSTGSSPKASTASSPTERSARAAASRRDERRAVIETAVGAAGGRLRCGRASRRPPPSRPRSTRAMPARGRRRRDDPAAAAVPRRRA